MSLSSLSVTVIALTFLQASTAGPQPLDPRKDRDAYALYATMLQPLSGDRQASGPIVLQRETERPPTSSVACTAFLAAMTSEWAEVAASFQRENSRVRLLQPGALGEYKLLSRAEILADDARLAQENPGLTNSLRPGAIQYIAISAVGFNAAKTKALVYARNRTARGLSDGIGMWELKEGRWVIGSRSCGGIA
jgi:hypothetical protein